MIFLKDLLYLDPLLNEDMSSAQPTKKVYILLTDTKTHFSRLSKIVTGDPYNHISIMLDDKFKEIFTYVLVNDSGIKGGLRRETKGALKGSNYVLYSVELTLEMFSRLKDLIYSYEKDLSSTSYNHLALINTVFRKEIFKFKDERQMICSQFVVVILDAIGVSLFKDRHASTLRPYEIVKSKLLKYERKGSIK